MTRVYTLYRVSTVGQVDHDDIPMQRIACHEFAQQQGDWEIVNELYEKGVSGYKVSTDKRDAISQLKVDALAGKFDVLLVFMFDRLGRRDDETPFVVQWFVAHGIRVWSVKEGEQRFDNHVDKLLNYIRFWQASGESEKTSIRIREKQTQMTIAGEYHGGMVPFGFDAICTRRVNKKGQPVKDLVRNEAEAAIKAELYHKVVDEGYGLHRLANWLNEQGIKTKRGTTLWRNTSVRAMIGNPIDRGQMHSGDVLSEPFEHLRIIDDYYFYKAVEIIRGRASTKREGPLRTDSGGLLTGMIYCGECGERLTINHCRKVTDTLEGQREYRWSVYRCYRKINSRKTCTGQSTYNAKRIDEAVLSIVRSFFARITTLPEADQMQAAMQRENLIREKAMAAPSLHRGKPLRHRHRVSGGGMLRHLRKGQRSSHGRGGADAVRTHGSGPKPAGMRTGILDRKTLLGQGLCAGSRRGPAEAGLWRTGNGDGLVRPLRRQPEIQKGAGKAGVPISSHH